MYSYTFYLDTGRDNTYGSGLDDITNYVETASWTYGHSDMWEPMANRATLTLTLNNKSGKLSQSNTASDYYGKFRTGTLCKVVMRYGQTNTTMCVLKLDSIRPIANVQYGDEFQYQVNFADITPQLLGETSQIPLQENVRVDEALTAMMDSNPFVYPYDSAFFFINVDSIDGAKEIYDYTTQSLVSFEQAYSSIEYVGDNLDRGRGTNLKQYITDLLLVERTGLLFWDVRTEALTFYNRWHNKIAQISPYLARESSITLTMNEITRAPRRARTVVNNLTVNYTPREIGVAGTVVAVKRNLPALIRAKDTKIFTLRYSDPDNDTATVGAKDVIPPVIFTDITATSDEEGIGANWTKYILLKGFKAYADRVEVTLFANKVGDPIYIQSFQVRGTPIVSYETEELTVTDGDSRYLYDLQSRVDNIRLISDIDQANEYAMFWTQIFATDRQDFESVTINIKDESPDWLKQKVIDLVVGDVITIRDSNSIESNHMIIGQTHNAVINDGQQHIVTYQLRPVSNNTPFIIDESSIDGTDLIVA